MTATMTLKEQQKEKQKSMLVFTQQVYECCLQYKKQADKQKQKPAHVLAT